MKKLVILLIGLAALESLAGQDKLVGKTLHVLLNMQSTTTITESDTTIPVLAAINMELRYNITGTDQHVISIEGALQKLSGLISVTGSQQQFNSEDSSSRNNPSEAETFSDLNKSYSIQLVKGSISLPKDFSNPPSCAEIAGFLFQPVPLKNLRAGLSWTDSSSKTNGDTCINLYMVTGLTKENIEIKVVSSALIVKDQLQEGKKSIVKVKQESTSVLMYSLSTGILKSASMEYIATGVNDNTSISIPITLKGELKINAY